MTDPSEAGTGPIRLPAEYDAPTPPHGARVSYAPSPWPPAVAPLRVPFPPQPAAPPPMGALRTERESVIALFLVHMFPIGHLPVAMAKPARQLPLPEGGSGPQDHPEADVLDDLDALSHVSSGFRRSPTAPGVAPPAELTRGHDPWGGMSPEEWEARFVTGTGYLWPDEADPARPVMLEVGTHVDRFGDPHGRVFAEDATLFAMRSLPPEHVTSYRRYRVVRPLPVWRSVAAGWFGQPGGGVRFRAVLGADELVTLGFLADVTGGGSVNTGTILRWLAALGVPPEVVSVGTEADNAWCLMRTEEEGAEPAWEVFWREQGNRYDWARFTSEQVACHYLFGRLAWSQVARGAVGLLPGAQ